jgi:hypothetical protein
MNTDEFRSLKERYEDMSESDLLEEEDFLHEEYVRYMKFINNILDRKHLLIKIMSEKYTYGFRQDRDNLDRITDDGK